MKLNLNDQGHSGGLRGIAGLPGDTGFFSCGLDSKVCRWGNKKLTWKSILDVSKICYSEFRLLILSLRFSLV